MGHSSGLAPFGKLTHFASIHTMRARPTLFLCTHTREQTISLTKAVISFPENATQEGSHSLLVNLRRRCHHHQGICEERERECVCVCERERERETTNIFRPLPVATALAHSLSFYRKVNHDEGRKKNSVGMQRRLSFVSLHSTYYFFSLSCV